MHRQGGVEAGDLAAGAAEWTAEAQRDTEAADGVDEQADLDAFFGPGGQEVYDLPADGIVAEDVGREADASLRAFDLPAQFPKGVLAMAVAEEVEAIASEIRLVTQTPSDAVHFLLGVGEGRVLSAAKEKEDQGAGNGEEPGQRTPQQQVGR